MTAAAPQTDRLISVAIQKTPNDAVLLSTLGYSVQKKGDIDRARELYEKARVLCAAGQVDGARDYVLRVLNSILICRKRKAC
jgi:uncharacterized protein HemY